MAIRILVLRKMGRNKSKEIPIAAVISPKCSSLGSIVHQRPHCDCSKTTICSFIASPEPTVRWQKVLFNIFFGVLSLSLLFCLAGEPDILKPDDWEDDITSATTLCRKRNLYRTDIQIVHELNLLL